MRSFPVLASTALIGAALALTSTARADVEINFGSFTPPGCASGIGGQEGGVCGPTTAVTATVGGNLDIFDIAGFSGQFINPADLTFKAGAGSTLTPVNVPGETGFGEGGNALGCTDAVNPGVCEIAGSASVAVSSQVGLIDAIVGSAQAGEGWNVWAGDSLATLHIVGSGVGSCDTTPDQCTVTFTPAKFVGLTASGAGSDVLLAGISVPTASVPEPASLGVLTISLLGLAVARRRSL